MAENLQFVIRVMDAAWFLEIVIWALSWVILCHGWSWRPRHPGRRAAELVLLAAATGAGQAAILLFIGTGLYLLLQIVLQGALGGAALAFSLGVPRKGAAGYVVLHAGRRLCH